MSSRLEWRDPSTPLRCVRDDRVKNLLESALMLPYFSTFVAGLDSVVERWLREDFLETKIDLLSDGLVIFETPTPAHQINKIRFLNNSFVLISRYKLSGPPVDADEAMSLFFQDRDLGKKIEQLGHVKAKSFKLVVSLSGKTVSIGAGQLVSLEGLINDRTGLKPDRYRADREFWIVIRSDRTVLFGLRISSLKKKTVEGELKLELANALCRLSDPVRSDIFMDPFCGSGAIFLERISSFPYKFGYAFDIDGEKITSLERKVSWTKEKVNMRVGDVSSLSEVLDESVDKILTYLSFGVDSKEVMVQFSRVLKHGGVAVVLTREEIKSDGLELKEKFEVLVSGQKMSIFKFLRV